MVTKILWPILCLTIQSGIAQETRQATGVKVGEITDTSAVVWMRVTANAGRNADGVVRRGRPAAPLPPGLSVDALEGACPGAPGRVRIRYGMREDLSGARATPWVGVSGATNYTHQFGLNGLKPSTVFYYSAETGGPGGSPQHGALRGKFQTAPPANAPADIMFTAMTCQAYRSLDHADGFHIYEAMAKLAPKFYAAIGDLVYYDSEDPQATTVDLARYHWQRMYSLPQHVAMHLRLPGYWLKDDHDTLSDDCWPDMNPPHMLPLTFRDGLRIFREQNPVGDRPYRTFRWGRGLQIWLTEGRDYRSSNRMPDGPEKTIWGREQKEWLKRTILASDADWKVLISPTPIVGPDRTNKADNHSNTAFAHEGNEFRQWVRDKVPDNFFVICGDRHWQYHSVHPTTGVNEFAVGPASDVHASGTPGENPQYHRFHRVKGGFLSVSVTRSGAKSAIVFRHHDVHGSVVYEYKRERAATKSQAGGR